ncbi:MAG: phosphoribosylaminoimidazolesuccinocarboxamide synthase, partial [Planctomycetota bacterium]|nr:phosphoribosylaminoimidazolesuccinocarboxamide synthase [Planctomycetota bacterium]
MATSSSSASATEGYRGGIEIPGWDLFYTGKVRDLYRHPAHPGHMLMVATDRLSAFDVVMNETIPDRGRVLTFITEYWLQEFSDWMPAARVTCDPAEVPDLPEEFHDDLRGRLTWTREADRVNVEVVLRAYLAGS